MSYHSAVLAALAVTTFAAPLARAQNAPRVLTLSAAIEQADQFAYANRGAAALVRGQQAASTGALRGILPGVRLEAGYARTSDPIGAFGTTLRQRGITEQDFNPATLNHPASAPNYAGAVVLEQPMFNADAWLGRRTATRAVDALRASADWTALNTGAEVIRAYYGTILAAERAATLDAALRAANEHVRQAEAAVKNGLVTPFDALLASVKAGDVETQLIEARGDLATARAALVTAIGSPRETRFSLPDVLPPSGDIRAHAALAIDAGATMHRSDVVAARAAVAAADADALRARSSYVPRLNGVARYDWNSALRPYGGEGSWTVGVMASWSVFSGGAEIADARATIARRDAAIAALDATEALANVERERTANMLRTTLARLDIAERSVRQSTDAHRIVTRRYDAGLATVVDLLDAAATETQQRLALASARFGLIVATADRRKALGLDPRTLRALDSPTTTTSEEQ